VRDSDEEGEEAEREEGREGLARVGNGGFLHVVVVVCASTVGIWVAAAAVPVRTSTGRGESRQLRQMRLSSNACGMTNRIKFFAGLPQVNRAKCCLSCISSSRSKVDIDLHTEGIIVFPLGFGSLSGERFHL
jgi:hypothetical protein